ncbi:MAG: DUF4956 domain-containing protein [Planctomycetota bacterium]|jgi:hypothetical protein
MPEPLPDKWEQVQNALAQPQYESVLGLVIYLAIGGVLAMYIRFLYRWTTPQTSADSIARVFPLLTLVTIAVISVVKSSLALSLGLVGALSIVRFRAAIKDPEELVYLFLCIGVGLALGAEQPWLALALVAVASVFVLVFDKLRGAARTNDAFLTIVGSASQHFSEGESGLVAVIRGICPRLTVERCDIDGDEGQLRVQLHRVRADAAPRLVAELRQRLPGCQISYVNAKTLL